MTTNAFVAIIPGPIPSVWEARSEAWARGLGKSQTKAFEDGAYKAIHPHSFFGPSKRFAAHYQAGFEWGKAELNRRAKEPLTEPKSSE